jgi:hypothetical protein
MDKFSFGVVCTIVFSGLVACTGMVGMGLIIGVAWGDLNPVWLWADAGICLGNFLSLWITVWWLNRACDQMGVENEAE